MYFNIICMTYVIVHLISGQQPVLSNFLGPQPKSWVYGLSLLNRAHIFLERIQLARV